MLRWPDGMQHAVFFVDAGCKVVGSGESEGWHVERLGTTREGCVTIAKTGAADGGEVESEEWPREIRECGVHAG